MNNSCPGLEITSSPILTSFIFLFFFFFFTVLDLSCSWSDAVASDCWASPFRKRVMETPRLEFLLRVIMTLQVKTSGSAVTLSSRAD